MKNYRIMFDLEATCWPDQQFSMEQSEIIEIGAVKFCPKTFEIGETFSRKVWPKFGEISPYCTELTGISKLKYHPKLVENGEYDFPKIYREFLRFCGPNFYCMAWGQFDYRMLAKDCQRNGLKCFPERRYMNAKHLYQYFTGKRAGGISKRIATGEVSSVLPQHRAVNDAIMAVEILKSAWKQF